MLKLTAVVLNYGTYELTKNCVNALLDDLPANANIVIVDNKSPDGSGLELEKWLLEEKAADPVSIILSPENHGFSGGNNLGIQANEAEHYLLINSDTLVRKGALQAMLAEFELDTKKEIGLVTPRLEFEDGTAQISCFRFHNPVSEFLTAAAFNPFTKALSAFDVPIPVSDQKTVSEWSSFACIMIRREVIQTAGLMDEGYFLYYEDTDYCRTAHQKGWLTKNVPEGHVVHFRGGSAELKSNVLLKKRLPKYYYASRSRYFYKFYGRFGLIAANVLWTLGATIGLLKAKIKNAPSELCEKQFQDIWLYNREPMKKFRP